MRLQQTQRFREDFGRIWMASSPLTERLAHIERAIECGVDAVVLKSVDFGKDPSHANRGKRIIISDVKRSKKELGLFPPARLENHDKVLYCTSTHEDVEVISAEESNRLHDQIKEKYPHIKVIANIAIYRLEDFTRTQELRGDAIELVTRYMTPPPNRPYLCYHIDNFDLFPYDMQTPEWNRLQEELGLSSEELKERFRTDSEAYHDWIDKKKEDLSQGAKLLDDPRPIIQKMIRSSFEFPGNYFRQIQTPFVDAITFSDSIKDSWVTKIGTSAVQYYGKGSICGEALATETLTVPFLLRQQEFDLGISASGGIFTPQQAAVALANGADNVQICSAVYCHGWRRLEEICEGYRNNLNDIEERFGREDTYMPLMIDDLAP